MHRLDTVHEQVQYSAPVAARGTSSFRLKHLAFPATLGIGAGIDEKGRFKICTVLPRGISPAWREQNTTTRFSGKGHISRDGGLDNVGLTKRNPSRLSVRRRA